MSHVKSSSVALACLSAAASAVFLTSGAAVAESSFERHSAVAEKLFAKKDYAGAAAEFGKAFAENPSSAKAVGGRAAARCLMRDFKGCEADATKALSLDGSNDSMLWTRGLARFEQKNWRGAIEDNDAIMARKPSARALLNRAMAKQRSGDKQGAVADAREAVKIADNGSLSDEASGLLKSLGAATRAEDKAPAPRRWTHASGALSMDIPAGLEKTDIGSGEDWEAYSDNGQNLMVFMKRAPVEGAGCDTFMKSAFADAPARKSYELREPKGARVVERFDQVEKTAYWHTCFPARGKAFIITTAAPSEKPAVKMPDAVSRALSTIREGK